MGTVATTGGFLAWFSQWGQVVYIVVQMLFWAAIATAAIMVAMQYKRLVTFKVGGPLPKADPEADASAEPFVE
jgi:hypothetical protein